MTGPRIEKSVSWDLPPEVQTLNQNEDISGGYIPPDNGFWNRNAITTNNPYDFWMKNSQNNDYVQYRVHHAQDLPYDYPDQPDLSRYLKNVTPNVKYGIFDFLNTDTPNSQWNNWAQNNEIWQQYIRDENLIQR